MPALFMSQKEKSGYLTRASLKNLQGSQQDMEIAIGGTPSGEVRNHLTEANIHTLLAIDALKKATAGSVFE